jgi:hypothetical protein
VLFAAGSYAETPVSATLTWTSRIGDKFGVGDGKLHSYTSSNFDFNNETDNVIQFASGVDENKLPIFTATGVRHLSIIASPKDASKTQEPGILFSFSAPDDGLGLIPRAYTVTSSVGTQKAGSATAAASIHTTPVIGHCGTEDAAGTFNVVRAAYESYVVVDSKGNKSTIVHTLSFQMHFEVRCSATDGVFVGDFLMSNKKVPGAVPLGTPLSGGTTGGNGSGGTPLPTSPGPVVVLPDSALSSPIVMANSATSTVPISTFIPTTVTGNVSLTASTDADDLLASVSPSVIPLGGSGNSVLTIRTTPTTLAGDHVVTITASDGVSLPSSASIFVTVICDPPFILGIDQPKSSTVSPGRPALLSVKASGSGPFSYQWYTGSSGLVNFPLAGGTTANFTTSAINDTTSYWVRVTNPCGSADSQAATVAVSAGAKPTRR